MHADRDSGSAKVHAATEAAVWRVEALKETGGFDCTIKGAAEDVEAAYRIGKAGWTFARTDAVFQESCRETWRSLWSQYFWYGQGAHAFYHKDKQGVTLYKMVPPVGFMVGVWRIFDAYRLVRKKSVLLLPFHYAFKRMAWLFGFVQAQLAGYGHQPTQNGLTQ